MRSDFMFQVMMVPVFTPFMDDNKRSVNYDMFDKYCQYLKSMGMMGIMVNGWTGEGMCLNLQERMRTAEKWMKASRKYDMKMMLNIGGMDLPDCYEMAEHAEKIKVDAVMLLPDLFFKPMTEEDLKMYLCDIMKRMPTRPTYYYHIPMMTGVHLDMCRLMQLMEKDCQMFRGLFWAWDRMDMLMMLKEKMPQCNCIVGTMSSMMWYMSMGIDAISMTAMNFMPDMMKEMWDHMMNKRMNEAMMVMEKMNKRISEMMRTDMDWMKAMRMEMDKMNLKMDPMRRPAMTMNRMWMDHQYHM